VDGDSKATQEIECRFDAADLVTLDKPQVINAVSTASLGKLGKGRTLMVALRDDPFANPAMLHIATTTVVVESVPAAHGEPGFQGFQGFLLVVDAGVDHFAVS
jgi:hypothetical protein